MTAVGDAPDAAEIEFDRRCRTFVEQAPAVVYIEDEDGVPGVRYINEHVETLLGYPRERWLTGGLSWTALLHPDDTGRVLAARQAAGRAEEPFHEIYRYVAADGRTVWVDDRTVPVRDPETGLVRYWQGFMLDVTERKQAEERARAADHRYRSLVEQLPAIVWTRPASTTKGWAHYDYVNPRIETIFGVTAEAYLADPGLVWRLVHPDDSVAHQALIDDAWRAGRPYVSEYRVVRPDGELRWVRAHAHLVQDAQTGAAYWHGVSFDVTDRKRAEDALRESDARFRAAFDHAAIGMALVTPDGRFARVNRALCDLAGYPDAELFAMALPDLIHPDDRDEPLDHFGRLVAGERPSAQFECRFVRRDGGIGQGLHVLSTVNVGLPEGRSIIVQVVDVTRIREADRLKDEFVATVSHELRTPLTSISGFVDLLLDGAAGDLPSRGERYLHLMRNNSRRLAILIDDLLDLSRIEAGRLTLRRAPIELPAVIQTAIASIEPQLAGKDQRLRVHVAANLPAVLADGERVAQVLVNLLSNAHKYTPAGGEIAVQAVRQDGLVRVAVADTGIGLSREEQALVFTRFFRADRPAVKEAGGTGLGLAIARALVELHGGAIDVASAPGDGATFGFTLPIAPPPDERPRPRPNRTTASLPANGCR